MERTSQYTYDALPTEGPTRILVLYPAANFKAPIEVNFEYSAQEFSHHTTISHSAFDEISYCWGEPDFTRRIDFTHSIGGSMRSIAVTARVDSILRHMRRPHKEKRLWIDAICINQTDLVEKAIQVRHMGEIHRAARKVRVWLGAGAILPAVTQQAFTYFIMIVVEDELREEQPVAPMQQIKTNAGIEATLKHLIGAA